MSSHLHSLPIFFTLTFQHKTFIETFSKLFTVNPIDLCPLEARYPANFGCMQNLCAGLLRLRKKKKTLSIHRFNYTASTPTPPRIPLFIPPSYTVCTAHVLYMCFTRVCCCVFSQTAWLGSWKSATTRRALQGSTSARWTMLWEPSAAGSTWKRTNVRECITRTLRVCPHSSAHDTHMWSWKT